MDPLTQGLLGASFGQALYGRALGKRALVWGATIGMAPDLDIVASRAGGMAEWIWHRGPTHALWFGVIVGPALAFLLWRWKGGRLRDWTGLAVVALVTHPLLDLFTTYGTQLLAPFSRQRFAWNGVAIVDPAYSLVLVLGLAIGLRRGPATSLSRRVAWGALALSTGYLLLGVALNGRIERGARAQLAAEGVREARVEVYPTMFQLPFRRVVARSGNEVRVGWTSALGAGPIAWQRFEEAHGPMVEAARGTYEAQVLEWFAMGQVAARVVRDADGTAVELDDLRYGFPGRPRDGLWGVRVRLDASGRPLGSGVRFDRPLPETPAEMLGQIARGMLGMHLD